MLVFSQFCGLFLCFQLLDFVQCDAIARGCTLEDFKRRGDLFDENFEISNLRDRYSSGSNVRVPCKVGYRGFFKLRCRDGEWFKIGDICSAIVCGHPGDVLFADFKLVKGADYVFGSQVQYTCHKGYQMSSFSSTRNCLQEGWDGRLPECEPIPCPTLTVPDKVRVNGDLDQAISGSVLQFSCRFEDDELEGPSQIACDDNGDWDNAPPTCEEISCDNPPLENFRVDGGKYLYKKNEVLSYTCNEGFKKVDGRPSICKKVVHSAQWTPTPQCELVTCKLSQKPPVGTRYDPLSQNIFLPSQTVTVSCGSKQWVKSRELQSAVLTCQPSGQWDFDPVCQWVKCSKIADRVTRWGGYWYGPNTINIDESVWYDCDSAYMKTSDSATCTRAGWEPNPLCKERSCTNPLYKNAEITYNAKNEYEQYERVYWRCMYEPTVTFDVYCYNGEWRGSVRTCKEKPCTTRPHVENGEILHYQNRVYGHDERVLFRCEGKTDTFTLTCKSGEWTKKQSCQVVPCKEQPVIANGEMFGQKKRQYEHGDTVVVTCTTGAMENLTVSCQSGEWIPEHQCPEKSVCENTVIPNGFSHEDQIQKKLYYSCDEGFKLLTKGWWGVASCEQGKWKTSECVAKTDCGPVPDIPNMMASSDSPKFSDGDTISIHCEAGHQNLHRDLKELTCINGKWTANDVRFTQICTPIAKNCPPPPKIRNAVIMAAFEKEYPSDSRLTYKCRDNFIIEREDTIQCNNGTWERKDIICKEVTCDLPALSTEVNIFGVEEVRVRAGNRITVQCARGGSLKQLECLSTGQWNSTFPTCTDICKVDVVHVPDSVVFSPGYVRQLQRGQTLEFRCKDSSHILRGAESITCLEDGQWSHTFPSCSEVTCELPASSTRVNILGADGDRVTVGNRITVRCVTRGRSQELECLSTGQWSSTFPTCIDTCDVAHVPDSVVFSPESVKQINSGQSLGFRCKDPSHILDGVESITCLEDGQWSQPFPSCSEATCELPTESTRMNILGAEGDRVTVRTRITVQCVTSGRSKELECLSSGQWSSTIPTCTDICDVADVPDSVLFSPYNVRQLQRGRKLKFHCKDRSHILQGAEWITCLVDGQWSQPFPSCSEVTCALPASSTGVNILGAEGDRVTAGHRITVECVTSGRSKQLECLSTGQWSSTFPTCIDTCDVAHVPDSVLATRNVRQLQRGQTLKFRCKDGTHTLRGAASITCLEDGQWSQPFPSCSASQSCGSPPSLENGDYLSTNTQYEHNEEVEYLCQNKYVMQGGPHKTCLDGVWTGEITCLKPCTVDPERMRPNKIKFIRMNTHKLYASHNDFLTFECIEGATHDGVVALRQKCNDGAIDLPRCV